MTIVTIITNANDHTVYFKEPIKNFQFIKLVSCSLYNSWKNLKESGTMTISKNEDEAEKIVYQFPPGHHTLKSMLFVFQKINYFSQINSPRGILVFPNMENETITELSPNLLELFGIDAKPSTGFVIKKLKTPHSYFIHCDLIDKTENLLNRKPSNLLAKFSIRGQPYEKINYISPSHEVFRDATSRDNYLHSLAISVKDENGNLFDFEGFPLEFEIEIK